MGVYITKTIKLVPRDVLKPRLTLQDLEDLVEYAKRQGAPPCALFTVNRDYLEVTLHNQPQARVEVPLDGPEINSETLL